MNFDTYGGKNGQKFAASLAFARNPGRKNPEDGGYGEEMGDNIILSATGLTKEFKGFVAVDGVDLAVERGSIHALIGPNGAGKTTCFNLLTKFLQPTRSEEHTSELQSLMRISYAVFCLKQKTSQHIQNIQSRT